MQPDQRFDPKSNSIGLLRLLLAIVVLSWHSQLVGHVGDDPIDLLTNKGYSTGAMAVDGFFAFSGYLITASYFRLKSFPAFVWHRVLRIFPAYWVCILVTTLTLPAIFGIPTAWSYLWANFFEVALASFKPVLKQLSPYIGELPMLTQIVNGQNRIPGVFEENFTSEVNGSLWTLRFEFRLYIIVAILGWMGLIRKGLVLLVIAISWAGFIYLSLKTGSAHSAAWPRTTIHFFLGIAVYLYNPQFRAKWVLVLCALAGVGLCFNLYAFVGPFAITYLMFWLARVLPFPHVFKHRDYSYGVYIYGYPIQQLLTHWEFNRFGYLPYFGMSIIASMAFAVLSWHLIEKPALGLKWLVPGEPKKTA